VNVVASLLCDAALIGGSWSCCSDSHMTTHVGAAVSVLDPAKIRNIYITVGKDYREVSAVLAACARRSSPHLSNVYWHTLCQQHPFSKAAASSFCRSSHSISKSCSARQLLCMHELSMIAACQGS